MRSTEHERIAALRQIFGAPPRGVQVGIGDDAAVLAAPRGLTVVSVDAHVEGTHFTRALMSLRDAGFRATMAALSDLAAMGARPTAVFSALGLPKDLDDDDLYAIAEGQADAAGACGTAIAGGNLTSNPGISITTTVLGEAARPVLRSGARPADAVLVGGDLGWSAAGLALVGRAAPDVDAASFERAQRAFRRPTARIDLGLAAAAAGVTSMIDVSDGLAADAAHVANESGVDLCIDASAIADPALEALVASAVGPSALDLVLGGGEDFALLATAPSGVAIPGMRVIGRCRAATGGAPGVFLLGGTGGGERRLDALGFDHFRG